MHAIVAHSADRLRWQEVPDVSPAAGEVVVEVSAAGVNRADLLQAAGKYPPPPGASEILGLEVSGTIAEVGDDVDRWPIGQPVCALLAGGGYAEFVAVPAGPGHAGAGRRRAAACGRAARGGLHGVVQPGDDRGPRPARWC